MTDPIDFAAATPRFALPLLHLGQARKETLVNEALARTDALLHCTVEGEAATPPENPSEGTAWIVAEGATGDWAGCDGMLAMCIGGGWTFTGPRDGLRILDRASGQEWLFLGSWRKALLPLEPLGGSTVDVEARATIADLVASLQALGILPSA